MDKYLVLMKSVINYLDNTYLSQAKHYGLVDKGSIAGNSLEEIKIVEQEIERKLPKSMLAWYQVAGKVPPYLYDHDADFSLRDLRQAQETATTLLQEDECEIELSPHIIPFSQRLWEQFSFVDLSEENKDDPPVFHCIAGHPHPPERISIAFSVFMRETWLQWLENPAWDKENRAEISSWREKGYKDWFSRKAVVDELRMEVRKFREALIERIHHEDLKTDVITEPKEFQERWLEEFSVSEIWRKCKSAGLRFPFNWISAPIE